MAAPQRNLDGNALEDNGVAGANGAGVGTDADNRLAKLAPRANFALFSIHFLRFMPMCDVASIHFKVVRSRSDMNNESIVVGLRLDWVAAFGYLLPANRGQEDLSRSVWRDRDSQ